VLMEAAKWARSETVKVLLNRGANLHATDEVRCAVCCFVVPIVGLIFHCCLICRQFTARTHSADARLLEPLG
jgi:hypothetical protein